MIQFVQKWLNKPKLRYKIDNLGNIYVKNEGSGTPILFCVHMDTVNPGKGIKPIIKNGIIKSSGNTILGADNKAAVAALITAIDKYLKTVENPKAFELLFTVKEETGGGVEFFPFEWIKSKKALVFDSAKPLGGIILSSPFIINFNVEIIGKAAHSSTPDLGKNTLVIMNKALSKIKIGFNDGHKTTINVGLIQGGSGVNIIPDKIKLSGEIRSRDQELFKKNLERIKEIFLKEGDKAGVKITFTTDGFCPGYNHAVKQQFVKQIKKILIQVNLIPKFYHPSGVSDANILNSKGIETINLTDGVKNAHCIEEEIAVKDLEKLEEIIYKFLLSY